MYFYLCSGDDDLNKKFPRRNDYDLEEEEEKNMCVQTKLSNSLRRNVLCARVKTIAKLDMT